MNRSNTGRLNFLRERSNTYNAMMASGRKAVSLWGPKQVNQKFILEKVLLQKEQ